MSVGDLEMKVGRWALTVWYGIRALRVEGRRSPGGSDGTVGPIVTSAPAHQLAQCNFDFMRKGGTFPPRSLVLRCLVACSMTRRPPQVINLDGHVHELGGILKGIAYSSHLATVSGGW
jgi:hypothetical protein